MWNNTYQDHKLDEPFSSQRVGQGKGIVGCEMHELNGWGTTYHRPKKKKPGLLASLLRIFSRKTDENHV